MQSKLTHTHPYRQATLTAHRRFYTFAQGNHLSSVPDRADREPMIDAPIPQIGLRNDLLRVFQRVSRIRKDSLPRLLRLRFGKGKMRIGPAIRGDPPPPSRDWGFSTSAGQVLVSSPQLRRALSPLQPVPTRSAVSVSMSTRQKT